MGKGQEKRLTGFEPHVVPVVSVVPHVDAPAHNVAWVDFLPGGVGVVGFDFIDDLNAVRSGEGRSNALVQDKAVSKHRAHRGEQEQHDQGKSHG